MRTIVKHPRVVELVETAVESDLDKLDHPAGSITGGLDHPRGSITGGLDLRAGWNTGRAREVARVTAWSSWWW